MVQTIVLPVVIVGMQFAFSAKSGAVGWFTESPERLAATAFGTGAYALMFSAFQTLNAEGRALWVLYTIPHSIEKLLRQKALFWMGAAIVYPLIIFGLGLGMAETIEIEGLALAAIVLAGLPIYAAIATALGVFACDPLALEQQRKVRPDYLYLYMLLAGFYTYAIFVSGFFQRTALMVLCALVAVALWQKARDHLPYLLDPTASPPYRVSVSDGLIGALMFFVIQGFAIYVAVGIAGAEMSGRILFASFGIAGALTYVPIRYVFWRTKTAGVPKVFGRNLGSALTWGVLCGAGAALLAILYLYAVRRLGLPDYERNGCVLDKEEADIWLVLLVVVAAPIFEEFIFRGLIFGGLARSMGLFASVAGSAGIFALVHPPFSVIPAFCLGAAAALAYARNGVLLSAMAAHAIYNAIVIAFSFYGSG
jgi:hypothetical protein